MLKKTLILLGFVLALMTGGLVYLVRNANSLAAEYKPQLEAIASKALGTTVSFGELSVSVLPSTKIGVRNTSIGHTANSQGLELKNLELSLGLTALLRGALDIKALILHSPRITLVKQDGAVSIEGLPSQQPSGATTQAPKVEAAPQPLSGAPLTIALEKFLLDDGSVILKDFDAKSTKRFESLSVESSVRMGNSSIELPSLSLSGSLNGAPPVTINLTNLFFDTGSGELKAREIIVSVLKNSLQLSSEMNIKGLTGAVALSSPGLDLAALRPLLKELSPAFEELQLTGAINPKLNADFDQRRRTPAYSASGNVGLSAIGIDFGPLAIRDLKGALQLSSNPNQSTLSTTKIMGAVNGEPIELAFKVNFSAQNAQAQVESVNLLAFGGSTKAALKTGLVAPQSFSVDFDAKDLDIAKLILLAPSGKAMGLSGRLPVVRAKLSGTQGDALMNSLQGTASVALKDGALAGTNIVGGVVKQVAALPVVSPGLLEGLDPRTRAALDSKDTVIGSLSADFVIAGGGASTSNLSMTSPFFTLAGAGTARFDSTVDLSATITLSPDLSAAVVRSAKGLSKALDANQRLALPLRITGKTTALKVLPNTEKLLAIAAEKALEKGIQGLLKSAGDGKQNPLSGLFGRDKKQH